MNGHRNRLTLKSRPMDCFHSLKENDLPKLFHTSNGCWANETIKVVSLEHKTPWLDWNRWPLMADTWPTKTTMLNWRCMPPKITFWRWTMKTVWFCNESICHRTLNQCNWLRLVMDSHYSNCHTDTIWITAMFTQHSHWNPKCLKLQRVIWMLKFAQGLCCIKFYRKFKGILH